MTIKDNIRNCVNLSILQIISKFVFKNQFTVFLCRYAKLILFSESSNFFEDRLTQSTILCLLQTLRSLLVLTKIQTPRYT